MKKLLLTSTGFANENIINQFNKLIDKPISQIKILFVPTAARSQEELKYVEESKKELFEIGIFKKIRESGFDKVIKKFVALGKLYFGVSAGSILVCPNIEIAKPFDENDINLTDLTGLNLVDFVISPHYCLEDKSIIDDFKKKYNVIPLTDNQALLILGDKIKLIE